MKKLGLILVVAMLLVGCVPSDAKCNSAKMQLTNYEVRGLDSMEFSIIMYSNHAPNSVGQTLFDCIEGGWEGWR